MKLRICVIGKPKLEYAKSGLEEYLGRLRRYTKLEMVHLKEGSQAQEGERLLEASEGFYRVAMDERGQTPDTLALKAKLEGLELQVKGVAFLIGGADGHGQKLRDAADWLWSLSKLTLQHELALLVLLEQLYRVETLKKGEPYHR